MKTYEKILTIIGIIAFAWIGISYIEILSQNLDFNTPTELSTWNFFEIFIKPF